MTEKQKLDNSKELQKYHYRQRCLRSDGNLVIIKTLILPTSWWFCVSDAYCANLCFVLFSMLDVIVMSVWILIKYYLNRSIENVNFLMGIKKNLVFL